MSKEIVEKELNKCFRESTLFRMFEFLQVSSLVIQDHSYVRANSSQKREW